MASACSGDTGRFLAAAWTPATTLARANGSRSPERLTTTRGASSRRSKVVKRRPHARHSRRRRMAAPSSASRESTTLSSTLEQDGQRTLPTLPPGPRPTAAPLRQWDAVADLQRGAAAGLRQAVDQRPDVAPGLEGAGDRPERLPRLHDVD